MADVVERLEAWVNEQAPKILAMYRFDTEDDLRRAREAFDILRVRLPTDLTLRARLSQGGGVVEVREEIKAARTLLAGGDPLAAWQILDRLIIDLAAPPIPTASVEAVRDAWSFLQDRLLEFEQEIGSGEEEREWAGHVMPALSRFGSLIASLTPAQTQGDGGRLLRQLRSLAVAMHSKHYSNDMPGWQPLEDAEGLLSQIDNMTTGLARTHSPAPVSAPSPAGGVTPAMINAAFKVLPPDAQMGVGEMERVLRAALSSPATPEPVSAPAGEVVEALREARNYVDDALADAERDLGAVLNYPTLRTQKQAWVDTIKADLAKIDAALSNAPGQEAVPVAANEGRLQAALDYLAENKSRSLAFDGKTFCEDDNSDLWIVTEVQGGMNDREWVLIGSGGTPAEALMDALPARPAGEKATP